VESAAREAAVAPEPNGLHRANEHAPGCVPVFTMRRPGASPCPCLSRPQPGRQSVASKSCELGARHPPKRPVGCP
jgi:hypothetical protein